MAVRNGMPLLFDRHVRRLADSCRDVYQLPMPESVEREALATAKSMTDAERLRIDIVPSESGLVVRMDVATRPDVTERVEVEVAVAAWWRYSDKWIDRSMLPTQRTLFVDDQHAVLEMDFGNVFAVLDGEVVTPPLDGRILPGVARSWIMDICTVRERPLLLGECLRAEELFASNAVRGVIPVSRCENVVWLDVGRTTAVLMNAWEDLLGQ
jgi:para-aminobenzoate synthetase/4-amino-4-deoxychorismate lyase